MPMIKNGGGEKFFGAVVSSETLTQNLNVLYPDPSPPGEALLRVTLQGLADASHDVEVLLNGVALGAVVFRGQGQGTLEVPLSPGALREGENTIGLTARAGETDVTLVDSLRLTYWRTFTADQDVLRFPAAGGKQYTLDGFGSSQVRVMDITDPAFLYEIRGNILPRGSGYSIQFQVPGNGERTLLAFTEDRVGSAAALEAHHPTAWNGAENGADLVIICSFGLYGKLAAPEGLAGEPGLSGGAGGHRGYLR